MAKFKAGDHIVNIDPAAGAVDRVVIGLARNGRVVYEYMHNDRIYIADGDEKNFKLKPEPVKKEGWVNIWKRPGTEVAAGQVFDSKEEAQAGITTDPRYITTIKIEWEQ